MGDERGGRAQCRAVCVPVLAVRLYHDPEVVGLHLLRLLSVCHISVRKRGTPDFSAKRLDVKPDRGFDIGWAAGRFRRIRAGDPG